MSYSSVLTRLNQIAARGSAWLSPWRILCMSLVTGILWSVFFLFVNNDIYRDVANCYAWYGREFGRGVWNSAPISALPPLYIFLTGILVRCGLEAFFAIRLLSLAFYLLTILPLYGLLKFFVSPRIAAWGTLLYITAPKIVRFAGMGLLEAGRDFFLITGFFLLFRMLRFPATRRRDSALLGGVLGLLALVRGEGMILGGLLGAAMFVLLLLQTRESWGNRFKHAIVPLLLAALIAGCVVAPRLLQNYRDTGYPVIDTRMIGVVDLLPGIRNLFEDRRVARELPRLPNASPRAAEPGKNDWERLQTMPKNLSRGAYEPYLILMLLGIAVLLQRREWRREYSVLVIFTGVTALIFCHFAVAYRYFVFVIPLGMVFTLTGIGWLLKRLEAFHLQGAALAGLGFFLFLQTSNAPTKIGFNPLQETAGYLKLHKTQFLPPLERDRKLIVHAIDLAGITYWCDEGRYAQYNEEIPPPQAATGFDILAVSSDETKIIETLRARADLREAPSPVSEIRLFTPNRSAADEP